MGVVAVADVREWRGTRIVPASLIFRSTDSPPAKFTLTGDADSHSAAVAACLSACVAPESTKAKAGSNPSPEDC